MSPVLRTAAGGVIELPTSRWRAEPHIVEQALLLTLADPILDVGCGPGRITAALALAGRLSLGIDPSVTATTEATSRGAPVLCRSVFAPLPGEGRWASVLLLDGNAGIGGDPVALLGRVRELLAPGGQVVVEVEPPGAATESFAARVEHGDQAGQWFPWARVGADGLPGVADAAGLAHIGFDVGDGRWFGRAVRPG